MRISLLAICVLFLSIGCKTAIKQGNIISIIPKPASIENKGGTCLLDSSAVIQCMDSSLTRIANYLWTNLKSEHGLVLESVCRNTTTGSGLQILLSLDSSMARKEGYRLEVDQKEIRIIGKDEAGLFYGIQTFLQLIPTSMGEKMGDKKAFLIPLININDYPRFAWRGMLLDVCRHFFPLDSVKKVIDIMAIHKLNVFHWHLTDDQGWRIEIKKYPRLTDIGAWRVNREDQPWDKWDSIKTGEKATYGGFYTQSDIREIVKYAQDRFITIVPEIEMPAHAMAALAAYPELSCDGKKIPVVPGGVWPITHIYCAGNDNTFKMLEEVLTEVFELFPSKYIHIGGDEATKTSWEKCRKCQLRIKTEGLKNVQELQSYFIKRIEKFIVSKNRNLIGWDEILEGGLAPEATVMSWRGISGGIEAARQNHFVVMTPTDFLYLDYYQAQEGEPLAIGGFLPLDKVYGYEPIPTELDSSQMKFILGAQANVWTEYIHDFRHLQYMMLPRLCALSELAWSQSASRNYDDFTQRMAAHYNRLDFLKINYRQPDILGLENKTKFDGKINVTLKSPRPEWRLHYTLDGTEPLASSKEYKSSFSISSNRNLFVRPFLNDKASGKIQKAEFIKLEYIDPSATIPTVKGLNFDCFRGEFTNPSQLDTARSVFSGVSDSIGIPMNEKTKNSIIVIKGYLKIEKSELYKFTINYDSWSNFQLDGTILIDPGMESGSSRESIIKLRKGFHAFKLIYYCGETPSVPKIIIESKSLSRQLINQSFLYR